ncbi:hypothetical protein DPMN_037880 [Dreissena polymorpha]|uniref:Uncharacterized protein n=1 Tax=Dreissena polymorpha TaxID=45954 RepID=A0A9D4MED7_DREPO|nr:hypothetical protein DPMN_037880 [Dreissena polymorpha]
MIPHSSIPIRPTSVIETLTSIVNVTMTPAQIAIYHRMNGQECVNQQQARLSIK